MLVSWIFKQMLIIMTVVLEKVILLFIFLYLLIIIKQRAVCFFHLYTLQNGPRENYQMKVLDFRDCYTLCIHHISEAASDGHVELHGRQRGRAHAEQRGSPLHVVRRANAYHVAECVAQRRRRHRRDRDERRQVGLDPVALRSPHIITV